MTLKNYCNHSMSDQLM